ncbi:MAG: hypothetical protein MJZ90_11090 [Bacteroidales bacterium]|nr:hypothetical protein [Bacteroidales bacterium]
MSKYDFSSDGLLSLVPMALRKPVMIRFLKCLLIPVTYMHELFLAFKEKKEYRLAHSGQVYALTQVVCDFCRDNGCYITDGSYIDEVMLPYDGSNELIHYQIMLPYDGEVTPRLIVPYSGFGQLSQADFIIHLPTQLAEVHTDIAALRQLINEYKLAGKFYDIVFDGVVTETYDFQWSEEVCVKAEEQVPEAYGFEWGDGVCVLAATYTFAWSEGVCVQTLAETTEPYTCQWKDGVCVQALAETTEPYTCQWKDGVCVKTDNDVKTT